MRNVIKLALGWTGTATIATAATVALLQGESTARPLSQGEVTQRIAAGEPAPRPAEFHRSVESPVGQLVPLSEAVRRAGGTKVVTPRGTVTIGCLRGKSRVAQVLARTPRAGSRTHPDPMPTDAEALAERLNIPGTKTTWFWPASVSPQRITPSTPHTLVFNWCEAGEPKWRVVNR